MKLLRALLLPPAFAVVIFTRLYKRKRIRFGMIYSHRLGHLIGNTECYLAQREGDTYDIWYHGFPACNKVIAAKYDQILHIWPKWFASVVMLVNGIFPNAERHQCAPLQHDRDITNAWRKPHIGFTKEENLEGQALLRKMGVPRGARWVCMIVRDSSYLKTKMPGSDFSYHDYRDADIDDYALAAIALAERGLYVIRMGEITAKPVVKHPRIIDYAPYRTELGDLYLGAKCDFCLGTSTGFMVIPQVFKRPCAVTDFVPIEYISTFCRDRVIWKHHMVDGREMTFQEIIDSGAGTFMAANQFAQAGITLKNNTPEEIRDLALEMLTDTVEDQTEFWEKFPRSISPWNARPLHGKMYARIGRSFARLQNLGPLGHQGAEPDQAPSV